jgi:hypothetical protein
MGLSALVMLYLFRYLCSLGAKRQPYRRKSYFILATMRTAFVILLYTFISFLVNRNRRKNPLFRILRDVPRGQCLRQPMVALLPLLPLRTLVALGTVIDGTVLLY